MKLLFFFIFLVNISPFMYVMLKMLKKMNKKKIYIIDIDETVELTQGQSHKVKGQGHICTYVNIFVRI